MIGMDAALAEALAQLRATPAEIRALLDGATPDDASARADGNWSAAEIVGHLLDSTRQYEETRFRRILAEDHPAFVVLDEAAMVHEARYAERDPRALLTELATLRARALALLAGLTPEKWARTGQHAVEGRVTMAELVMRMAAHDRLHLAQLRERLHRPRRSLD